MTTLVASLDALKDGGDRTIRCPVGVLLTSLDRDEASALMAALDDPLLQHTSITKALEDAGYRLGVNAVPRHRRHQCSCQRNGGS